MAAYVKITDFAIKDGLVTGNPAKIITGAAIDAELNAIATSSSLNYTTLTTASNAATASAAAALVSETNAAASAVTATTQANNAAASAVTATTQAGTATTQASNASSSASTASTQASNASTSAGNASTSETNAAASAVTAAAAAAALVGTSTSSLLIAVASKTFTTQASKQFAAGQFVLAVSAANSANYMHGQVTSYSGVTLVVDVQDIGGIGTLNDWNLSVSGSRGAVGATGATGSTGATGAGVPANLTLTNPATAATLTLANNSSLITSGAFSTTLTSTATTVATLPAGTVTLAQLGANTFTATQIYSDQQNSRAMFIDCGYTFLDKGNSSTTTQTFDYTAGSHQKVTATGNHTIALSNPPPTGNLGELLIEYVNGGAFTLTFPTISWIKPDGVTTTSIATYLAANTGRTALQTSGTDFILLWTRDAGTTWYGKLC